MMLAVVFALTVLAIAVGIIYWLLKSMGEEGIEIAAPGSCKSGRCGVRPRRATESGYDEDQVALGGDDEPNSSK